MSFVNVGTKNFRWFSNDTLEPYIVLEILSYIEIKVFQPRKVVNDIDGFGYFLEDPQRKIWWLFPTVVVYPLNEHTRQYVIGWKYVKTLSINFMPSDSIVGKYDDGLKRAKSIYGNILRNMGSSPLLKDLSLSYGFLEDSSVIERFAEGKLEKLKLRCLLFRTKRDLDQNFGKKLKSLSIDSVEHFDDSYLSEGRFSNLEHLMLVEERKTYSMFTRFRTGEHIRTLSNLKSLTICHAAVPNFDWSVVRNLDYLENLSIDTTGRESNAENWENMPKSLKKVEFLCGSLRGLINIPLEFLNLCEDVKLVMQTRSSYVGGGNQSETNLRSLTLKSNININDDEVSKFLKKLNLSKLTVLNIESGRSFQFSGDHKVSIPTLKELSLTNRFNPCLIIGGGFSLRTLVIGEGARNYSTESTLQWKALVSSQKDSLENLKMIGMYNDPDEIIRQIPFRKLRSLELVSCWKMKGDNYCQDVGRNLEILTISEGIDFGDAFFQQHELRKLRKLVLDKSYYNIKGDRWIVRPEHEVQFTYNSVSGTLDVLQGRLGPFFDAYLTPIPPEEIPTLFPDFADFHDIKSGTSCGSYEGDEWESEYYNESRVDVQFTGKEASVGVLCKSDDCSRIPKSPISRILRIEGGMVERYLIEFKCDSWNQKGSIAKNEFGVMKIVVQRQCCRPSSGANSRSLIQSISDLFHRVEINQKRELMMSLEVMLLGDRKTWKDFRRDMRLEFAFEDGKWVKKGLV